MLAGCWSNQSFVRSPDDCSQTESLRAGIAERTNSAERRGDGHHGLEERVGQPIAIPTTINAETTMPSALTPGVLRSPLGTAFRRAKERLPDLDSKYLPTGEQARFRPRVLQEGGD